MAAITEEYEKRFDEHKKAIERIVINIGEKNELGDKTEEFLEHFNYNKEFLQLLVKCMKTYLKTKKEDDGKKISNLIIRCFDDAQYHLEKMRDIINNSNHPRKESIKKVINDFIKDILKLWGPVDSSFQ